VPVGWRRFGPAGKQGGDAARNDSDNKNNDTRGFHTGNSYNHAVTRTGRKRHRRRDRRVVARQISAAKRSKHG
jgi:hypothetical protein